MSAAYYDDGRHGYLPPSVRLDFAAYELKIYQLNKLIESYKTVQLTDEMLEHLL